MIVADTGAIVALINADDEHHAVVRDLYEEDPGAWLLPWAILPEVDYLLLDRAGVHMENLFLGDLADGRYRVEWDGAADVVRAREICESYADFELGMVDGVVMAVAERIRARAIATLDLRHFGAVALKGQPRLLPRDV